VHRAVCPFTSRLSVVGQRLGLSVPTHGGMARLSWQRLGLSVENGLSRCTHICYIQGPHASWKVLDFFLKNSRTWKVLENYFGPGKSWKLKLEVLESPGKISLKVMYFSSGLK